jgi:hypothetical protein
MHHPVFRRFLLTVMVLLLLVLAWGTIYGGLRQAPRSATVGQRIETAVQLACGLLSGGTALTCFWGRRWAGPIRWTWAASVAMAAGLSSLVWGPPMPMIGVLFTVGTFLVALLIIRALRVALGVSSERGVER